MKLKITFTLSMVLFGLVCFGQAETTFEIQEQVIDSATLTRIKNDFSPNDSIFFEDEMYSVKRTCRGEWGGTIWFTNKTTGIEYSCSATCPVAVNKLNGKYYISNALAHMSGFSEVLEISNPDSLSIFKMPKPVRKKGRKSFYRAGDDQSKSQQGAKVLVDTFNVLILASFPHEGILYHVITDFKKTYVAKIENNQFVTIDTVHDESIWTYGAQMVEIDENHYVVCFANQDIEGYLEINDNTIIVHRLK